MATKPAPVLARNGRDTIFRLSPAEMNELIAIYRLDGPKSTHGHTRMNPETGNPVCGYCEQDYTLRRMQIAKQAPWLCVTCANTAEDYLRRQDLDLSQEAKVRVQLAVNGAASMDTSPGHRTKV